MVLFNHATREMTAKIVYYGPGLCGKTTNLMVIFDKLEPQQKGKMLSLATKTDRTLFFDLLPVDVGKVGAFNLKIQLYTVPGQVFYNETRKLVLKGADSVVFVADSQPAMVEANRESFANLLENLEENNIDPNDTPIVIQYNKRDLPGVVAVETLQETLGFEGYPYTEAAAIKGEGVMETFRLISKITAKHLYQRLKGGKSEAAERKKPERPTLAPRPKLDFRPEPEPAAEAPVEPALSTAPPMPDINPFADSVPFPDSAHADAAYERMEEVSLEQLLSEGRERPATFSGNVPIPVAIDEVEELGAAELVEEPPIAVAIEKEPPLPAEAPAAAASGDGALELRVRELEEQIESMRAQHRAEIEEILRSLGELTSGIRSRLL
jgi:signal recognition particle receptor subunit beta